MDLGLKNYMEDIVAHKLDLLSNEIEICDCGRCRMDIMAYVLNKLPPKYVVTNKGTIFAKLSVLQSQFDIDIVSLITQAAAMVQANPRHDDNA